MGRWRTGVRLGAGVAVAGLVLAGAGTAGLGPVAGRADRSAAAAARPLSSEQAQRVAAGLLAQRDRAVRAQDLPGYLAGVDPAARGREASQFAGIEALRFDEYTVRLEGALTPRSGAGARYWEGMATSRTRLAVADASAAVSTRAVRFREAGGRLWLLPAPPPATGAQTWEAGLTEVFRGRRSLVVGPSARSGALREVSAAADDAVLAVTRRWGSAWSRYAVVVLPRDLDGMARLLDGAPQALAATAAVTTTTGHQATGERPTRVVINPVLLPQLSDAALAVLLRHEVTHVAARIETAGLPRWLTEGIAEYVAIPPGGGHSRDRSAPPPDEAFDGPPVTQAAAYVAARAAVRRVVDRWGEPTTMALYRRAAAADRLALHRLTSAAVTGR